MSNLERIVRFTDPLQEIVQDQLSKTTKALKDADQQSGSGANQREDRLNTELSALINLSRGLADKDDLLVGEIRSAYQELEAGYEDQTRSPGNSTDLTPFYNRALAHTDNKEISKFYKDLFDSVDHIAKLFNSCYNSLLEVKNNDKQYDDKVVKSAKKVRAYLLNSCANIVKLIETNLKTALGIVKTKHGIDGQKFVQKLIEQHLRNNFENDYADPSKAEKILSFHSEHLDPELQHRSFNPGELFMAFLNNNVYARLIKDQIIRPELANTKKK